VKRALTLLGLVVAVVLGPVAAASAHPLGNFTINHYSGIHVSPDEIRVDYVIDMAEIPAFQEMEAIDTDGDGEGSDAELAAWAESKAPGLAEGLSLSVDGREVPLEVRSAMQQGLHAAVPRCAPLAGLPQMMGTRWCENRS